MIGVCNIQLARVFAFLNAIFSSGPVVALQQGITEGEDKSHEYQEMFFYLVIGVMQRNAH